MLDWAAPLWLLLLPALPVLRLLHRRGESDREIPVSALFLWRSDEADSEPEAEARRRPDPIWWLRAAIAALLLLGLAGPRWPVATSSPVAIWIDDGPSLATLEEGGTRAELAVGALVRALEETRPSEAVVHSLRRPGRRLELAPEARDGWGDELASWIETVDAPALLPNPASTGAPRRWLVSDAADPEVAAAAADFDRVFQLGSRTENGAVTALALRPQIGQSDRLRGLVRAHHSGARPAVRRLRVSSSNRILLEEELEFAPGASLQREFTVDGSEAFPSEIAATLEPPDALPADDRLRLDTSPARRVPTRVDSSCGAPLRSAVAAHPGLTPLGPPELAVWCSASAPPDSLPTLWIRSPEMAPDAAAPDFATQVAALLDGAAGRDLLLRIAATGRRPASARIAPAPLDVEPPGRALRPAAVAVAVAVATVEERAELAPMVLAAALLLLIADSFRRLRKRR